MLVDGTPKIRSVAEAVGASVRTLQRRLSNFDMTSSAVIEAAQTRTANELLAPILLPIDLSGFLVQGFTPHEENTRQYRPCRDCQ